MTPRLVLVAAIAIAVAAWWWWPGAATPPPAHATAASHAAAAAGAWEPALAGGSGDVPARSEVAAPRTAVIGRALDPSGAGLAGFQVSLQRVDPRPLKTLEIQAYLERRSSHYPIDTRTLDAAGAFAFEALDAGEYRCHLVGVDECAQRFALGTGEVHEVVLVSPLVALTGTLFRAGAVVRDCFVRLDDGAKRPALPMPDHDDGTIRAFAAPGRYEALVYGARQHDGRGFGPCLSRHVLLVPPDVGAVRWQLETGGTEIAIDVVEEHGVAVDAFTAVIEGKGACDGATGRYLVRSFPGHAARLAALPAGEWEVSLPGDVLVATPQKLTTGVAGPRQVVSFKVVRAASVRLRLRVDGRLSGNAPMRVPPLRAGARDVAAKPRGERDLPAPAPREAMVFEYPAVPPGSAELRCEDTLVGDELVPLPFDPVAPMVVDVLAGQTKEIVVDVTPRAVATLHACDEGGRMLPGATIDVWAAQRRVRRAVETPSPAWVGWLPPGDYRVVIDRKGVRSEHALRVGRADVQERYRP